MTSDSGSFGPSVDLFLGGSEIRTVDGAAGAPHLFHAKLTGEVQIEFTPLGSASRAAGNQP